MPTPRFYPASEAVPVVLGPDFHLPTVLHAYAMTADEMLAIYVDGDWHYDGAGGVDMESLFGDLAAQAPDDKIICAIVIKGSLIAPHAVLSDRDTDWAPSLIVGGDVRVCGMCLGGGATRIVGDLTLSGTLYGKYNHGSLDVGGATVAPVILSSDFSMDFHGEVRCAHVLSSNGRLNIPTHHEDEALERILQPDLLDAGYSPIDELVMQAVFANQSLLLHGQ